MTRTARFLFVCLWAPLMLGGSLARADERPIVIAHRGASGYLPEHTLAAKALAHAMGADYIEQDLYLTHDGVPVVLHDEYLEFITDVAERFPNRARDNGHYYAIDFSIDELRQLRITGRVNHRGQATNPNRFPVGKSRFTIVTLREELELIQGLNQTLGRQVGIYPEVKRPAWHQEQGQDISRIVLGILADYGYDDATDKVYLQCFDPVELRRMRKELGTKLKLVQLIGHGTDHDAAPGTNFDDLLTDAGLRAIAEYAQGIGPDAPQVVAPNDDGTYRVTPLVELAHRHSLQVHPYSVDPDALPNYAKTYDELLEVFYHKAHVDGIFTDFPDRAVKFLRTAER